MLTINSTLKGLCDPLTNLKRTGNNKRIFIAKRLSTSGMHSIKNSLKSGKHTFLMKKFC